MCAVGVLGPVFRVQSVFLPRGLRRAVFLGVAAGDALLEYREAVARGFGARLQRRIDARRDDADREKHGGKGR